MMNAAFIHTERGRPSSSAIKPSQQTASQTTSSHSPTSSNPNLAGHAAMYATSVAADHTGISSTTSKEAFGDQRNNL